MRHQMISGLAWLCFLLPSSMRAQSSGDSTKLPEAANAAGEQPATPKLPKKIEYSKVEIQAECRKYEGKLIAFYDQIFQVKSCKRHELLQDSESRQTLVRSQKIINVEASTIAKIPQGDPFGTDKEPSKLSCSKIDGRYVMTRGDEVYYIEKCKKRLLPDWDTYADHARKLGKKGQAILEMSEEELSKIKSGEEMKSVLDDEYKQLLDADKGVDIIPLEEACKGLNGKFVAYYSKIYKIEKCKKRPVDAEQFVSKNPRFKVEELSGEQWISLPTGSEYKLP